MCARSPMHKIRLPCIPSASPEVLKTILHTQVIGIKKLVVDPMKRTDPTQSTLRSFSENLLALKASFNVSGTAMKAMPMKGRLR